MGMVVFDWLLDGDDMPVEVFVDVVNHAGQRRGLTTPGRAGDQKQAARPPAQGRNDSRQADLVEAQQFRRDQAEHHRYVPLLAENRCTEAAGVAEGKTKVRPSDLLELLLVLFRRNALHQGHGVVRLEHLRVQRPQSPADPQHRRPIHHQVEVRTAHLDARFQQPINVKPGFFGHSRINLFRQNL